MKLTKKQQAYLTIVATDLNVFLQQAFNTIYPNKQYLGNWHIYAIVHCLEQSIRGELPRLIINMPPRHLKSFIATVVLPAFILAHDPTAKIICISYSDELAKTLARDFRRIVESEWYRKLFPKVISLKATENEFVTSEGGFRFATSINGTLTGRGGDFIIIDDPIKPEDTYSDKMRQSVNDWFKSTLLSRLDDKKRSVLILVMQRLHVNDLTGFVEEKGGFHKLSLPAISTHDEAIPIGQNVVYSRVAGSALHEKREDLKILQSIRDQVGPSVFSAQYQQRPESPEGGMFKKAWMQLVDKLPIRVSGGRFIISIDGASSTSPTADYTAISIIYSCATGHFVLFTERGHWDYETLLLKALSYAKKYKEEKVTFIIENTSSGISLLRSLKNRYFDCISAPTRLDKQTRASYIVPCVCEMRLFIVNIEGKNSWVEGFINEILSFPHGRYDDQVDSLVHAIMWAEPKVNPKGRIYLF